MKYLFNSFVIFILLSSCQTKDSVDIIIHGGTIYTVDSTNSKVESIALKDGLIYQIGDFNKIFSLSDQNTEIIKYFIGMTEEFGFCLKILNINKSVYRPLG